jgi:hypothetical protein
MNIEEERVVRAGESSMSIAHVNSRLRSKIGLGATKAGERDQNRTDRNA